MADLALANPVSNPKGDNSATPKVPSVEETRASPSNLQVELNFKKQEVPRE
jgi:hypothetical protein